MKRTNHIKHLFPPNNFILKPSPRLQNENLLGGNVFKNPIEKLLVDAFAQMDCEEIKDKIQKVRDSQKSRKRGGVIIFICTIAMCILLLFFLQWKKTLDREKNLVDTVAFLELQIEAQEISDIQKDSLILEYKTKIEFLSEEINKYQYLVSKLGTELSLAQQEAKEKSKKIAALSKGKMSEKELYAFQDLKKERYDLSQKIEAMRNQRDYLLLNMERIDKERIAMLENYQSDIPAPNINQSPMDSDTNLELKVSEEMQAAIATRQQERLNNIVRNTAVKFSAISLRNSEDSKDLKKLKTADNWHYTFIDFDFDNADREAIMDETFVLQIYDLDNNLIVPFNEKNNAFPNSEIGAIGYKFKYDGKPISVRYINTQAKEGRNYEIRLAYFKNGLTFKLANGAKKIVEEGRVIVD